jgi:hypothetical protein
VSAIRRAFSALGKLGIIIAVAVAFLFGLFGTIYYSLRSKEINVPNIVGKDVLEGEQALYQDGLNMRRRATRFSASAKPNTILDQSPHAGEIIKVGQTVAVVISRSSAKEGEEGVKNSPGDTPAEENNSNANAEASASKNENANSNKEKSNRNARNRNSNNGNNGNANNSNGNRNANVKNANNRNANDRNANNRNANNGNVNANRGINNSNRNSNSGKSNSNTGSNKRTTNTATPPSGQNRNRKTP